VKDLTVKLSSLESLLSSLRSRK